MVPTATYPDFTSGDEEVARGLYRIYVVALAAEVMSTSKFAQKNPGYRPGQPCYFVDVTDLPVDLRFDQHMQGIKDNAIVRMYGPISGLWRRKCPWPRNFAAKVMPSGRTRALYLGVCVSRLLSSTEH